MVEQGREEEARKVLRKIRKEEAEVLQIFSSLIIVNTYYYHISVKGASVKLNDYHDLISYYCERCFNKIFNYCE